MSSDNERYLFAVKLAKNNLLVPTLLETHIRENFWLSDMLGQVR